jgi:hypothetical protein
MGESDKRGCNAKTHNMRTYYERSNNTKQYKNPRSPAKATHKTKQRG